MRNGLSTIRTGLLGELHLAFAVVTAALERSGVIGGVAALRHAYVRRLLERSEVALVGLVYHLFHGRSEALCPTFGRGWHRVNVPLQRAPLSTTCVLFAV